MRLSLSARPAPEPAARDMAGLPGPRGLPLLGNLLQLNPKHIHRQVEQWGRQYGPFFRFRLGPTPVLAITGHEAIDAVLRDRPGGFRRVRRTTEIGREMGFDLGLFFAEGQAWENQRRMVIASFASGHIKAYFPALLRVVQRLHRRWLKAACGNEAIALQSDLMRYTVDVIAGLAFGMDMNTLESQEDVIQHHLDKVFPALVRRSFALVPYWRLIRLPADRQLDRSAAAIRAAIDGFIAQARASMLAEPALREHPGNLLQAMIVAAQTPGSGVDDGDVASNVMSMLLAGEETTANTLAWMIYLLQSNPGALALAREEVWRVAGEPAAGEPAALTLERIGMLDYVEACALEAMRLKPVAPFMTLEAMRDTAVAGIRVPAGTLIWLALRHDNLDERCFPDAAAFQPERWLNNASPQPAGRAARRIALPFGSGPRICPGRHLAMIEIKMAMAMLLNCFDMESVGTADGKEPPERMAFTMAPAGLFMRLRANGRPWAGAG